MLAAGSERAAAWVGNTIAAAIATLQHRHRDLLRNRVWIRRGIGTRKQQLHAPRSVKRGLESNAGHPLVEPSDPHVGRDTGPTGSAGATTRASLRVRNSLAARISALVLLVLLAAFASSFVVLRQLREMQGGFDRLVEVYAVFDKRLAEAHVQAVRIGEQVRTRQRKPDAPVDAAFRTNFEAALRIRSALVGQAREPIDAALLDPQRFGGEEELAELLRIQELLSSLQSQLGEYTDSQAVLDDVRTQGQIEQIFEALRAQSGRAIEELRDEVLAAQHRTERWTLGLALATLLIGVIATIAVFLTLRPLRRLSQGVRELGRGDWSQRVLADHAGRGDEVGRLAEEFNLMAEALEERERRLIRSERLAAAGQLAAQITHEIRNPLSSVALNVELLEDELEGSVEGRRLLSSITKEVDRLTNITESYLGFARRPKPELVPLDLADELRALLDFLGPELEQDGVALTRELPERGAFVLGDANQLRQAFLNLLRNAKEAVLDEEHGGIERAPRISVALVPGPGILTVAVGDNGGGIPLAPDQLERIFEAFYTRKARGTGLGLPMVQQIVADHLGTVRVAQTGPGGTRFEVELPAHAAGGGV
jgi:two-component system, NtrC family, sensor kinase